MKERTLNSQCWVSDLMKFVIIALLCPLLSFSQTMDMQIQEFEEINSKSNLTSKDVNDLLVICAKMVEGNSDVSLKYLQKVKVAIDSNNRMDCLVSYATVLTKAYQFNEQSLTGLKIVQDLYKEHKNDLKPLDQIHLSLGIIIMLDGMSEYKECLPLIKDAFQKLEKEPESEDKRNFLATLYNVSGSCSIGLNGDHKKATAYFLKALRLYKQSNKQESINNVGIIYNRLGLIYKDLEDYPKSISYFREGIELMEKSGTSWKLVPLYSNLGMVYQNIDSLQMALDYEKKALKISQRNDQKIDVSRIYAHMGGIYLKMKDYQKALEYTKLSLDFCRSFPLPEGVMHNYISLGNIYFETNKYKSAETAYDSAMVYVKDLVMPRVEVSLCQRYSELYKKTGDFNKALEYQTKLYDLEKEFFGQEKQQAIAKLEIEYQTELKDQQIENAAVEIKAKKMQNKLLIIGIVAIMLVMGFVVFFLIYRNRILKDLYARNVELMNNFGHDASIQPESDFENPNGTDGEPHNLKAVFERLLILLKDEKIYTDPELSLSKICEIVKSNEKYVSSAIANYGKTNYSNFINFYRINEAKRLIYETNSLNLNEVMYASGFNSRTTFYTAFKKHTGMSPKQFKEMS